MKVSTITTDRLSLRMPEKKDLQSLFEIHGDPNTNQYNPSGPQKSITDTQKMLQRWLDHWQEHKFGYWAIALKEDPPNIIGCGGLMYKEMARRQRANLYFRFRPSAWGHGYASEMAKEACRFAFEELDLQQVTALVRLDNLPSIRLLERLKMIRRGIIKDHKGKSYFYVLERSS